MNSPNIKIYEMIYQKCTNENSSYFFTENNLNTRKQFVEFLHVEIKKELEDFKTFCSSGSKDDLLKLYEEIYAESTHHLNEMKQNFIEASYASFDDCINLNVFERPLIG